MKIRDHEFISLNFRTLTSDICLLTSCCCVLMVVSGTLLFAGCIRLQATGVYQGPGDAAPKVKQVGVDTSKLLPQDELKNAQVTL